MANHVLPMVVAIVALLGCSAFFSSTETALFTVSREWLAATVETDARAQAVAAVLDDPHRLLVTILVGNNVVNAAISSLVTALLVEQFQSGLAVVLATVVASSIVLVAGEIVPKAYGLGNAERYSLRIVGPLRIVELVLYPVVLVFDRSTRKLTRLIGGRPDIERPYEDESGPKTPTTRE